MSKTCRQTPCPLGAFTVWRESMCSRSTDRRVALEREEGRYQQVPQGFHFGIHWSWVWVTVFEGQNPDFITNIVYLSFPFIKRMLRLSFTRAHSWDLTTQTPLQLTVIIGLNVGQWHGSWSSGYNPRSYFLFPSFCCLGQLEHMS